MNIILRELRSNLKGFLVWIGSFTGIIFLYTAEFAAFNSSQEMIDGTI